MRKKSYKDKGVLRTLIPTLLVLIVAVGLIGYGLKSASGTSSSEGLRIAADSIRRAAVTCYSIEGRYPDRYEYLTEHYGVSVDEELYLVEYEIFASNMMPAIAVFGR